MSDPPRVALRWLGTATVQLRFRGHELLFDPYLSRPAGARPRIDARPEDLAEVSLVLVSHGHFDHAQGAARVARLSGAQVLAPRATLGRLRREGVGETQLRACEDHTSIDWHGAPIRILPSRHIRFDPRLVVRTILRAVRGGAAPKLLRLARAYPMGSNSDFLLELGRERMLFSGSGGGDWHALARLAPTTFLLPFAGRSDVVSYYLRALRRLRPRTVVLHHFDDFFPSFSLDYPVDELRARMARELPAIRLVVPKAEQWFEL
jgi:L-ascorbate metabolism protein UlaG (beta-lactamase superfamily)